MSRSKLSILADLPAWPSLVVGALVVVAGWFLQQNLREAQSLRIAAETMRQTEAVATRVSGQMTEDYLAFVRFAERHRNTSRDDAGRAQDIAIFFRDNPEILLVQQVNKDGERTGVDERPATEVPSEILSVPEWQKTFGEILEVRRTNERYPATARLSFPYDGGAVQAAYDVFAPSLRPHAPVGLTMLAHDKPLLQLNMEGTGEAPSVVPLNIAGVRIGVSLLGTASAAIIAAEQSRWPSGVLLLSVVIGALLAASIEAARRAAGMGLKARNERARFQALIRRLASQDPVTRPALENAELGIWDWDIETGQVLVDARAERILGRPTLGDPFSTDLQLAVHPDDEERVRKALDAHLASQDDTYEIEYRARRGDGTYVWLRTHGGVQSRGADGRPLRMIGTIQDITQRKQAA